MGSTSVTTFLTKLLRPDKKPKQKQTSEKKRRHSTPGPDRLDIFDAIVSAEDGRKLPDQKHKQKVKYSSHQNLSTAKNRRITNTKQNNSKGKRHSAAFPSWFCVSGNTDTLDRTQLPNPSSASIISPTKKSSNGSVPQQVAFLRQGEGKRVRENPNRYSAPVPEWSAARAPINRDNPQCKDQTKTPPVTKARRDLSPISYRYDGTLEKPYVFPAGLTFGPDGRKLQLRRTTSSQNPDNSRKIHRPNEKVVKVDVHRSSTEDILMEYSYEENRPDKGELEFDVRKAFYLKYDSNVNYLSDQRDSLDSRVASRESRCELDTNRGSQLGKGVALDRKSHENRWKPKETTSSTNNGNGSRRSSKRAMRSERSKNRYSMPPKNEDCVYMGSFENVNMCNDLDVEHEMSKSALDIPGNESSSRDRKRNRTYRYSLPPRNTDLVFMGSLENINQLLTGNKDNTCGFSLANEIAETDLNMTSQVDEEHNRRTPVKLDRSEEYTIHEDNNDKLVVGGNRYLTESGASVQRSGLTTHNAGSEQTESSSLHQKLKRHSSPDLAFSTNLSIANINQEEHVDSVLENEEDDLFDISSLSYGRSQSYTQEIPFSRHTGRSSCMPGNKRSIAPPPAMMKPFCSPISAATPLDTKSVVSTFLPGNKRFSIPPPPNYTPPKEEMEFIYGHLKQTACHKGSQTDLSVEFESLNMEDRDTSLQREDFKTIIVEHFPVTVDNNNGEVAGSKSVLPSRGYSSLVLVDKTRKVIRSPNGDLSRELLDDSNVSQGSDEVFRDNQSSYNDVKEHAILPRFAKTSNTKSSHLERNHFAKISPVSVGNNYNKESVEVTNCVPTNAGSLHLSVGSGKGASSDSRTSITSTPKENRRSQLKFPLDSDVNGPQDKPIPQQRKINGTLDLTERAEPFINTFQKDMQQTCTNSSSRPVPKKRNSLTYSRSLSSAEESGKKLAPTQYNSPDDVQKCNIQKLARTQSCEPSGTLQNKQTTECSNMSIVDGTENAYEAITGENVYEVIDLRSNFSGHKDTNLKNMYSSLSGQDDVNHVHLYTILPGEKREHIYEECGGGGTETGYRDKVFHRKDNDKSDKQMEPLLSPLQKIKLDASPGQVRRNLTRPDCPKTDLPSGQLTKYCGLTTSLVDIFSRHRWDDYNADNNGRTEKTSIYEAVDDNNSIADDEMSLSNEEDTEERVKQLSLRRCVSADNLLRSGSILDRSMILAKRRKRRMRERQSKSHLSSSSDNNGFKGFSTASHLNPNNSTTESSAKVHYNKKKTSNNERLYKHKASHTDSGHDSDMVSPCTSPDTGRHIVKMTSLNYAHTAYDLIDACQPRQGTLPKKPWEIRLRNTQYLRKSRSRESLINVSLEPRPVAAYMF